MSYGEAVKAGLPPALQSVVDIAPERLLPAQQVKTSLLDCSLAVGVSLVGPQVANSRDVVGYLHGVEKRGPNLTFHFIEMQRAGRISTHGDIALYLGQNGNTPRNGVTARLMDGVGQDSRIVCLYGPSGLGYRLVTGFYAGKDLYTPPRETSAAMIAALVRTIGADAVKRSGTSLLHVDIDFGVGLSESGALKAGDVHKYQKH